MDEPHRLGGHAGESAAPRSGGMRAAPAGRARLSPDLLPRERLTRTLQEGRRELVLLSAPPGFGKTTLLNQWRAIEQRPFASLSLEPSDNDPVLLWTRIVEALRAVEPKFERAAQLALHVPQADILGAVLPLLSRDLRLVEHELVLVLDDYQSIVNPACHESIRLFLHWLPRNVTLAIATRADPPIMLATLRAGGSCSSFERLTSASPQRRRIST